jgi:hypothetical protein
MRCYERLLITFLRNGAQYSWEAHAPARVLVVMPFIFQLTGVTVTQPLPLEPDLHPVRNSVRQMSPPELAAWIESKKHCSRAGMVLRHRFASQRLR